MVEVELILIYVISYSAISYSSLPHVGKTRLWSNNFQKYSFKREVKFKKSKKKIDNLYTLSKMFLMFVKM